jgi:kelch repeat/BTB domain-containing protein 6/7
VHRVVVASVSPVLRKMFSAGMVESQSAVIELRDVSELAFPLLVEYAYTGRLVLSGSTVVAIIQAANHCPGRPGCLSGISVSQSKSGLYGNF